MSKFSITSAVLALALPCAGAFAQATAVSPTLPKDHRMITACDNRGNPSKYSSLSAVPGTGDRTEYALVFRDLANNKETIELVTTRQKAAAQKVQDYCDGVYTPAKFSPYYQGTGITRP